jgi:hypothetical protein
LAGRKDFFFEKKSNKLLRTGLSLSGKTGAKINKSFLVTAQVWRWPPPKASGKASGSFLKKEPKNFDKFRLSLCGKAEAS